MTIKDIWNYFSDWFAKFLLVVCIIAVVLGGIRACCGEDKTSSPVEEHQRIDSLKIDNSKLILEVEILDSIKNVKTIEVKSLDNDSTLRLFYELIRK